MNSKKRARVDVWWECNDPSGNAQHYGFKFADGLGPWSHDTCRSFAERCTQIWGRRHHVWLTTRSEFVNVLYRKHTGRPIHPGLKTFGLAGTLPDSKDEYNLADAEGWSELATAGANAARLLGPVDREADACLLDMETSLAKYYAGQAPIIGRHKMVEALQSFNKKRPLNWYWWGPRALRSWHGVPDLNERSQALVTAIFEGVDHCKFIVDYTGYGPKCVDQNDQRTMLECMCGAVRPENISENI